jgi:UDP-GlcNAc:undecaprenyl-phosphate GlcNAc-1-phosphate transferase
MIEFIFSGVFTFILSLIIINKRYGLDYGVDEKSHAIHTHEVSRMGGVAVFTSILLSSLLFENTFIPVVISTFAIFTFGLLEDKYHIDITYFKKIIFLSMSAFALLYLTNEYAYNGGFIFLSASNSFEKILAILIAFIGLVGFASAINFIDGLNGYAVGTSTITLSFFSYIFYSNGLIEAFNISLIFIGSMIGFLILNFPNGKIFLGDMGAHFIGFILAYLSLYLSNHTGISLWYPLTVLSIPVIETVLTLFRRIKRKRIEDISFSESENGHLHHLLFDYINKKTKGRNINAITSSIILFWHFTLNSTGFIFQKDNFALIILLLLNIATYIYIYYYLKE